MTDHYTDELFVSTDNLSESALVFPVSRILVDPERFIDDSREIMSKKGMGSIYTHSHEGTLIRKELTIKERLWLLTVTV
jgi:N-formylglutamate deformylase